MKNYHDVDSLINATRTGEKKVGLDLPDATTGAQRTEAVNKLAEFLRSDQSITELSLQGIGLDDAHTTTIASAIERHPTLDSLYIDENFITNTGLQALAKMLTVNRSLTSLSIERCAVKEGNYTLLAGVKEADLKEGIIAIADAIKAPSATGLKMLMIAGNTFGNEAAEALGEMLKTNRTLTTLLIANSDLGASGFKAIAEGLKQNTTLQHLEFGMYSLGVPQAEGLTAMAEALATHPAITGVSMESSRLNRNSVPMITDLLTRNSRITSLNLDENNFDAHSAQQIINASLNRPKINLSISGHEDLLKTALARHKRTQKIRQEESIGPIKTMLGNLFPKNRVFVSCIEGEEAFHVGITAVTGDPSAIGTSLQEHLPQGTVQREGTNSRRFSIALSPQDLYVQLATIPELARDHAPVSAHSSVPTGTNPWAERSAAESSGSKRLRTL